jgi:hypothetical protein
VVRMQSHKTVDDACFLVIRNFTLKHIEKVFGESKLFLRFWNWQVLAGSV